MPSLDKTESLLLGAAGAAAVIDTAQLIQKGLRKKPHNLSINGQLPRPKGRSL